MTTPHDLITAAAVAGGESRSLLDALAKVVPDPRDPRGIRYSLSALLTVAVCAVTAGASSFAEITDYLHDLDGHARARFGSTTLFRAGPRYGGC